MHTRASTNVALVGMVAAVELPVSQDGRTKALGRELGHGLEQAQQRLEQGQQAEQRRGVSLRPSYGEP